MGRSWRGSHLALDALLHGVDAGEFQVVLSLAADHFVLAFELHQESLTSGETNIPESAHPFFPETDHEIGCELAPGRHGDGIALRGGHSKSGRDADVHAGRTLRRSVCLGPIK